MLLTSCKTETKSHEEIENPTEFKKGEWISDRDSLNGVSIRKGKLAFFENMKFVADSIYDYKVVDSVSITGTRKNNIGTFIKRMNLSDTLYSEIIDFTDSSLTLRKDNEIKKYKLK
ncbi:hypothetical protein [uncultured Maribacter sp.]|uniref:hypothetical protein n=1 Tax=uncultured Maribacter sp. TaxID=431308 RepID=UPI0026170313|nr:hypothetical protein [uncultured Maribacter sp.]